LKDDVKQDEDLFEKGIRRYKKGDALIYKRGHGDVEKGDAKTHEKERS